MLEILYEDNHLLMLNKPAGLLTQPAEKSTDSLEDRAKAFLKQRDKKAGAVFLHAVHRLDKPVSGIVVFAKTSKALSRLNESQRLKAWHKVYQAEVEGQISPSEGDLIHYLKHDERKTLISEVPKEDYKLSKLHYKTLKTDKETSKIEIYLDSGRYHQIRAQLAFTGHPILGDIKYGAIRSYQPNAIALCHTRVEFPHPITKKEIIGEIV